MSIGDHPRVCGEHRLCVSCPSLAAGSSPRVRGTRIRARRRRAAEGIIPACAGNTTPARTVTRSSRDHPRVCGEHKFRDDAARDAWGSSPRVRGTPLWSPQTHGRAGIIPACAGNTRPMVSPCSKHRDHPRVCGEHVHVIETPASETGSSPRVRGTRSWCRTSDVRRGIIPACAGNTCWRRRGVPGRRDHPRVCGEH